MSNNNEDPAAMARKHAERYGIPPQRENEDAFAFLNRVAQILRNASSHVEAHEALHNQRDASSRVRELNKQGKKGVEIGRILLNEDYTIGAARDAFYDLGYVVSIQDFTRDIQALHVSDNPMKAGFAVLIASSEPRALPSVVWKK